MSTDHKPLLSDYDTQNLWDDVIKPRVRKLERDQGPCSTAWQAGEMGREIIAIYEADRLKTRELVQALLNALARLDLLHECELEAIKQPSATDWRMAFNDASDVISLAKSHGFTPTQDHDAQPSL